MLSLSGLLHKIFLTEKCPVRPERSAAKSKDGQGESRLHPSTLVPSPSSRPSAQDERTRGMFWYEASLLLWLPFLIFGTSLLLGGSKVSASLPTIVAPETVVTRSYEPPLENTSTTTLDGETIQQNQSQSLADALRYLPGISITQGGGIGQQQEIRVRGMPSHLTLFLIDGIRVSDPSTPKNTGRYSDLLGEGIQRLKVYRGVEAMQFGSQAIGGVISLSTPPGPRRSKILAKGETSHQGSFLLTTHARGQVALGDTVNPWNYNITALHLNSHGTVLRSPRLQQTQEAREKSPYQNTSFFTRVGKKGSGGVELSLFNHYIDGENQYLVDFPTQASRLRHSQHYLSRMQIEGEWSPFPSSSIQSWTHQGALSYAQMDSRDAPHSLPLAPPASDLYKTQGKRMQLEWQQSITLTPTTIFGATACGKYDLLLTHENQEFRDKGESWAQPLTTLGLYRHQQWGKAFSLTVGGQLNRIGSVSGDGSPSNASETIATYQICSLWRPWGKGPLFRAALGTGFNTPSLYQRFVNLPIFRGNPHLKTEKNFSWEIGGSQSFFPFSGSPLWTIGGTYFQNRAHNLIDLTGGAIATYDNTASARSQGLEIFIESKILPDLSLRVDHTYLLTKDLARQRPLLRQPQHQLALRLDYRPQEKLKLGLDALYIGPRLDLYDPTFVSIRMPGYMLLQVRGHYQLSKNVKLFARVENALNHSYENPSGYQGQGVGIFMGMSWQTVAKSE